jgi:uncharacterized repeat protein (TIGR03806 family)
MTRFSMLLALVALGHPGFVHAQAKDFECRWTEKPLVIDGKADDAAWQQAQTIDHFYLPWLKEPRPARTKTKAKLLWDRDYLYFFADMEDADLYADVKEHDGMTWFNDVFELFFKPADDKPGYYEFQVNAAGTVMDMFLPRRGAGGYQRFIKDGAFHVEAKVHLRGTLNKWQDKDEGWSVEGKIPWADFLRTGGRPERGERWKFALCRYDYSVAFEGPELSTSAPLKGKGQPDFHHFEDYATLRFVGPEKNAGPGLRQRLPLTTSRVVGSPEPPPLYRAKKVYPGLTIDFPVHVVAQPGSDQLLVIALNSPWGKSRLFRMKDEPAVSSWEEIWTSTDTAVDLIFHPRFADNGYFYIGSNGAAKPGDKKKSRVTRFTMERQAPYKVDPKSQTVIIEWESDGHNGDAIAFGNDGMLYVTSGDGTSDSDTNVVGQDMTTLLAKVLRLDVDHPEPGKQYSVPKDNPFVSLPGARPEIWALGLRNPWRITADKKMGHIWVGNNGQDLWEQAYLIKKGENYGWSVMEGGHPFYTKRQVGPTPPVKPTVEHHHSEARSLTGGIVYYGTRYPELQGAYLYGDYSTGKVWGVRHDGAKIVWHKEIADTRLAIAGFGADQQGEILVADFRGAGKGGLYTLEPTPPQAQAAPFPRTLSASGLFRSVKGHVMEPALIPYSVNAVLWSDGAAKERWLGLPDGGKIEYTTAKSWTFPEQTVIVKSFFLEAEQGNPASRRWIETRFLTKQESEWHGYSYAWNDEQTEGHLVEGKGSDREFTLRVPKSPEYPEGVKKQLWHYPSRTECMVCHSRAANWVLGLSELQMNKVHDYGGVKENQLVVFERLGLFKGINWAAAARGPAKDKDIAPRGQREPVSSSLLAAAPEKLKKLVDPYDKTADLSLRARSYLHSNCAQCHVQAGGGNAQMELEFTQPLEKMRLIDAKPQHDTYGIAGAALVVPGHPEQSMLLHRLSHRGPGHMPPLATRHVDRAAVEMMRQWIREMKAEVKKAVSE